MRRFVRFATVIAVAATGVTALSIDDPAEAAVPREHRVYMVTDSVGLGAQWALPNAFPSDWRVTMDGDPGEFVETLESRLVRSRMSNDPSAFGDHAIVAGGYNYPYWDPARFDRSIDSMIATLMSAGVKHVYWVTLREVKPQYISGAAWRQIQPYYWYFPTVNEHLEQALDRHPNLTLIDWAANADQPGLTYDAIHLNNAGAALYSELARSAISTAPTRVPDDSLTRIAVPDPDGVSAVAVNLTTVRPRHRGYLTAYDCDQPRPTVSSHNYVRDQTVAHATIVPLGPSKEVCVYASTATNLVVDLTGRFTGDVADSTATRVLDTRVADDRQPQPAFQPIVVDVGTTEVAAFTITAIGAAERGYVRVAPCGPGEDTSNLNMEGPDPVPNAAIVRPAEDGTVCVTTSTRAHLVLDRLATLPDDAGLAVEPPRRVIDTRAGQQVPAGGSLRMTATDLGVDATTTGVLLNLTATRSDPGYVTAAGCAGPVPETSSLNIAPGTVAANFVVIAPDAEGDICVSTTATTDLVIDVQGRIGGGFEGAASRLLDTRR